MSKTYFIQTFGCQMNEHDSEVMAGLLEEKGFEPAPSKAEADLILLNTCSIRDNADKRFFGTLGQLKNKKLEKGEDLIVCCTGCMMQQQRVIDSIKQKYPWVDVVLGTHNIHELPTLLDNLYTERQKQLRVWQDGGEIIEGLPAKRLFEHKSYVNITFGCNNFCTYCIVPYTRGRERSRKPEDIVREVEDLVANGVKEIMLLGQNVNSYKGDPDSDVKDFPDLVRRLNDVEGLERIRFMTSHPKDLSDKLIDCFRTCDKLCHNFHLPVQSGSDRILKRMNRRYTGERYLELVRKLREACPDISISTDIIVGFPGETEEDFQDTLKLCREADYDSAFTFLYSIRKGTPAAEYEDQIPETVKHERFNRLCDEINETSARKNALYVGRTVEVLCDGPAKRVRGKMSGRTGTFKLVNFKGSPDLTGKMVNVRITSSNTFSLEGELI